MCERVKKVEEIESEFLLRKKKKIQSIYHQLIFLILIMFLKGYFRI